MIAPIAPHGRPVDSRRFGRASTIVDPAPFASMIPSHAPVAELVDAPDSKSGSARSAGSSPARGTSLRWSAASARRALSYEGCRAEVLAKADENFGLASRSHVERRRLPYQFKILAV